MIEFTNYLEKRVRKVEIRNQVERHWCSGYHSTFPTLRPGFDSRMAHTVVFYSFVLNLIYWYKWV